MSFFKTLCAFLYKGFIPAFCFLAFMPSYAQEKERTQSFVLENGLQVFLYERHTLPLVNLVFAVNIGSKDEAEETNGLVHILEHYILFRGTEFRSGEKIGEDTRRHGAYFNAHTGRDMATFELSLPSEFIDFGLKNQKEILFNLKITKEELEGEKQVILEEISQIKDDPMRYATSLAYQNLFSNHPYEKPVYGKKETIESTSVGQIEKFYRSYFIPSNCVLVVLGDFKLAEMEEKVRSVFGDLKGTGLVPSKFEKVSPLKKTVEIDQYMDVNQGYIVIGMIGPDYNNSDQYAADLLAEIIGSGVSPLLNNALQGRRITAASIFMGNTTHRFGGAILIRLIVGPKQIKSAKREAIKFLKQSRNLNYSVKDYMGDAQFYALDFLGSAKNQITYKIHQSQERGLLMASSLARYMLLNEDENRGGYLENIDKVSSSDLRKTAGQYLSQDRYVIVTIYPKKEE